MPFAFVGGTFARSICGYRCENAIRKCSTDMDNEAKEVEVRERGRNR